MTEPVRIELFDGLRLLVGNTVTTRFRTQKTAALLAYLAYSAGRRHAREALIELIWPECEPAAGRHNLSNALSSLRVQIEPGSMASGSILAVDRSTVSLNLQHLTIDVNQFQDNLERARRADSPVERAVALGAAAELYRGELLRGHYEDWIFPEQARLGVAYLRALRELITFHETAGELDTAIDYATRAVGVDPLSEDVRYHLMTLYAAAGQHAVALDHYRELWRLMERELDATPGPELQELAQRLASTRPAVNPRIERAPPAIPQPEPTTAVGVLEPPGGAVPLNSQFYISRTTDREFERAIQAQESIVLVKGPRQTGKTSLLGRGLQRAREFGARVALTDLQTLSPAQLESADTVLFALAESLADQLDLDVRPRGVWDADRGAALSIRRYLRREVLARSGEPLVWAFDELDRLLGSPAGTQVFSLFRSWHNERALDPHGPWSCLTLAMAYATEAHLFIADLSQSPFNVGVRLELADFTPEQVADLNARYGQPLSEAELAHFFSLVGGHPCLVRRGLHEMARRGVGLAALTDVGDQDGGIFADHLHRLLRSLSQDPRMIPATRAVLEGGPCPSEDCFMRLRSAGVLTGESASRARLRCELYERVLRRHLL